MSGFDPRALRDAFGAFTTGVTVVTTNDADGAPIGFTANSFASVSLDPPLLLVCLARNSRNFEKVTGAKGFAVNVLSESQREVSNTFARPVEDRFAAVEWRPGPAGSPVFSGTAAWFDCETHEIVEAGDHVILVGRVVGFENAGLNGLGYARGSYVTPALEAKAAKAVAEGETMIGAVVEREGALLLMEAGEGRFALPDFALGTRDPVEALAAELKAATGLDAATGFLFSVFQDRATGRQHLVYRASLAAGEPARGRFFAMDALPLDRLASPQTLDILTRFSAEAEIGAFGLYVGNESAGHIHKLAAQGTGR